MVKFTLAGLTNTQLWCVGGVSRLAVFSSLGCDGGWGGSAWVLLYLVRSPEDTRTFLFPCFLILRYNYTLLTLYWYCLYDGYAYCNPLTLLPVREVSACCLVCSLYCWRVWSSGSCGKENNINFQSYTRNRQTIRNIVAMVDFFFFRPRRPRGGMALSETTKAVGAP